MKTTHHSHDPRKQILIVDDHPLVREGIAKVINQQEDIVVCGDASSAPATLAAMAKHRPDAAIVDIALEEGCGLDLIRDICKQQPGMPVLALSMHSENLYAERAIHAGARGYVMKREPVEVLLRAIRNILAGQIAVSPHILSRLLATPAKKKPPKTASPSDLLSDRELEVFRLFGEGHATRHIAARLHVSPSTIESYRSSIKQKLGLANGTELVARAARFVAGDPDT